jgi:glyceraldehyde 3-phosphate dehydrogenase
MKIAINGFGRIGRNFLRTILQDAQATKKLDVAVINLGPTVLENTAHVFKYDTLMGTYPGTVTQEGDELIIDGKRIKLVAVSEPAEAHWGRYGIEWVVDCSGKFTDGRRARLHIDAGARNVLISAPADHEDVAIIPGVNDHDYNKEKHHVVSLGSCTTNAFLPMLKVLNDQFGIEYAFMTTVHAYTASQPILDGNLKDPRKSRAGAINIIPTTTGAAKMVGKIMPDLALKIKATAMRVPVPKVSYIDLTFTSPSELHTEQINHAFSAASHEGSLQGILAITFDPIVSSDCAGTSPSVIIDGLSTDVVGKLGKVTGWYDNEWAYSLRLKDFLLETT